MSEKGEPLLLPREAAQPWAHRKGQWVEEGAADTASMACAARDPLGIAGNCWEVTAPSSAVPAWSDPRAGKNISKGAAGWGLCEQSQGPAGNIPLPRPG